MFVAYSPERIDPGNTQHSQEVVPRVIGGLTPACATRATAVIGTIAPVHVVSSPEAAELTKLYENTFRAVNIALANEIEGISVDYSSMSPRSSKLHRPSPSGSCPFDQAPASVVIASHAIPTISCGNCARAATRRP